MRNNVLVSTPCNLNDNPTEKKSKLGSLLVKVRSLFPSAPTSRDFNLYKKGTYRHNRDLLNYRILFPGHFDPLKKYPLVFILHGSGERGSDNNAQLTNGASLFLEEKNRVAFPAIVVFPQCSKDGFWSNVHITNEANGKELHTFQIAGEHTRDMGLLFDAVNDFLTKPYVDKNRVYIGGLSMGGMGVFELLRRKPDTFAAAFSICGGDNTVNAKAYAKKVPLWIFHGENDTIVPAEHSEAMVSAIRALGGEPKFTLYKNVGHNSWDNAFAEPDLLPWLFSHSKHSDS